MEASVIFSYLMVKEKFRERSTDMNTKSLIPTAKNGGVNVMVYGKIAASRTLKL